MSAPFQQVSGARVQAGFGHVVAHAHAAQLRLDDSCRPGAAIDDAQFGVLEQEALQARAQVAAVIRAMGVSPEMLAKILA